MRTISVFPGDGGWVVQIDGRRRRLFASGGRAETFARRIASLIARAGETVQLVVRDLNGRLVGAPLRWVRGRLSPPRAPAEA